MTKMAFIVGSPRSGTTILGEIFNCHNQIAQWYEPYYLWRKYFRCRDSEVWLPEEFSQHVMRVIREEHRIFHEKSKKKLVVEKMPSHAFNIAYILKIFPEAKFIHIIRDGRDVTLSIKKEWRKRREIVKRKNFTRSFLTAYDALQRAPFLRYKMMLAKLEIQSNFSLKPSKYLNKAKWRGHVGWGPRFDGWEDCIKDITSLQFNAMQWVKTVQAVQKSWPLIRDNNKIEIRYEDLVQNPRHVLEKLMGFLGLPANEEFFQKLPRLKHGNFNKWEKEFSLEEISQIRPILSPLLENLGYLEQVGW